MQLSDNALDVASRRYFMNGESWQQLTERVARTIAAPEDSNRLEFENKFAEIIGRQEQYGVLFDIKEAQKLHIELEEEKERMIKEVHKNFKPLGIWTKLAFW